MKKFLLCVVVFALFMACFGLAAQAKVGDVIDVALHTDIIVYINDYPIPSYAVSGQSVIVAEDLRNYGFEVEWNQNTRSLSLSRNNEKRVTPMYVGKGYTPGEKYTDIVETDIGVWVNGQRLTSYAMNGFTMIPVEELTMFGTVTWVPDKRILKMEIENFKTDEFSPAVAYPYYQNTSVPNYGWVTESICSSMAVKDYKGETLIESKFYGYGEDTKARVYKYIDYLVQRGWYIKAEYQPDIYLVSIEGAAPVEYGTPWPTSGYLLENPEMQCLVEISYDYTGTVIVEGAVYKKQ